MNQLTIEEIRDRIARFKPEYYFEPRDILMLLELLDALAVRIQKLEKK